MNIKQSLRKNKTIYLVEEKMTSSDYLSKLLTKKPQGKKERDIADQRIKSTPDQVVLHLASSHIVVHCGCCFFSLNKHVVGLIWRPESCTHWLFNSSMRELITDTLWL